MEKTDQNTKHVTVLMAGGLLSPDKMEQLTETAKKFNLTLYATTAQNIRLLGANEGNLDEIKAELTGKGFTLKAPGKFPLSKVCVGVPYCNLGLADTFDLSDRINDRYGDRKEVKPKFKISISGCPANCGGALLTDIGIVATKKGFDLYAGGKGGAFPRVGQKVAKELSADEAVDAVGKIADFHAANTNKKQRMFKLLDNPDFPFSLA